MMPLRIHVVSQDDPFYMPLFFDAFLDSLPTPVQVKRITLLDSFNECFPRLLKRMYGFYGPLNFLRKGIRYSIRKTSDAMGIDSYSVPSVAAQHGVPVEHRNSVNTQEFVSRIGREQSDVLVSVSTPEIFDQSVLQAPEWGCINIHTSKLPEYRGMLPTFWAMYHDEDEFGVTVHTMVEEIDRGRILHQRSCVIKESDTLDTVIKRGKREGGDAAARVLAEIENGTVSMVPMNGEGSYFTFPTAKQRREFQRRGNSLL